MITILCWIISKEFLLFLFPLVPFTWSWSSLLAGPFASLTWLLPLCLASNKDFISLIVGGALQTCGHAAGNRIGSYSAKTRFLICWRKPKFWGIIELTWSSCSVFCWIWIWRAFSRKQTPGMIKGLLLITLGIRTTWKTSQIIQKKLSECKGSRIFSIEFVALIAFCPFSSELFILSWVCLRNQSVVHSLGKETAQSIR